jgi:hypothetical protein
MLAGTLSLYRILLALLGMGLAAWGHLVTGPAGWRRRLYMAFLTSGAALSFYLYLELGPQFRAVTPAEIMNPHDFFHYYVGAKYHAELGYFDLYACTTVADWGRGKVQADWRIRDLRTYRFRPASEIAAQPERCRERFSDRRWAQFVADVRYFSRLMSDKAWGLVLQDKGYNATPVWNAFAAALSNRIALSDTAGMYLLLGLDLLWVVALLGIAAWSFGRSSGLIVTLFWGVNYMASTTFVKGSISRLDWLLCLVIAVALLRRGRHAAAGVAAGMAAASRIFPALFFIGLAGKCAWEARRTRSLPRRYLRFGLAAVVTGGTLVGLTSLTPAARQDWSDFAVKIRGHDEQIAGYRVGFKYALLDPGLHQARARQQWDERQPVFWAAALLAIGAVVAGARRLPDHQTLALSFVCVFFLTAPTFYYYQMLVLPLLLFLPDARRPGLALGLAAFFAWTVLAYTMRFVWPLGQTLSHRLSWSLVVLCALIVAQVFLVFRPDERKEEAARPAGA